MRPLVLRGGGGWHGGGTILNWGRETSSLVSWMSHLEWSDYHSVESTCNIKYSEQFIAWSSNIKKMNLTFPGLLWLLGINRQTGKASLAGCCTDLFQVEWICLIFFYCSAIIGCPHLRFGEGKKKGGWVHATEVQEAPVIVRRVCYKIGTGFLFYDFFLKLSYKQLYWYFFKFR